MQMMKWSTLALAVTAGTTQLAFASAQSDSKGFVEDSNLTLLNKNYALYRDFRNNGVNNGGSADDQNYQPVEIRRDDYAHCFWQQRSRSFTSRLGRQSMEIARFGVLQAHLPRQRAHAIEPVASSFGRRTRLLAAMASWNSASTRSSPRCFTWRSPAAALSQPKWVSIQARIFRLRP